MNSADYWMEKCQRLRSLERHKNWELGRRVEMLRARVSETEWKHWHSEDEMKYWQSEAQGWEEWWKLDQLSLEERPVMSEAVSSAGGENSAVTCECGVCGPLKMLFPQCETAPSSPGGRRPHGGGARSPSVQPSVPFGQC